MERLSLSPLFTIHYSIPNPFCTDVPWNVSPSPHYSLTTIQFPIPFVQTFHGTSLPLPTIHYPLFTADKSQNTIDILFIHIYRYDEILHEHRRDVQVFEEVSGYAQ